MDWQTTEDAVPSGFVTEARRSGAAGQAPAHRGLARGRPARRPPVRVDRATRPRLAAPAPARAHRLRDLGARSTRERDNAVLVLHALTGDSHVIGAAGPGHPTAGWWTGIVGPGLAIDTDRWFVVAPNMLGGCQGIDRPRLARARRRRVGRAVPVPHHPRPGRARRRAFADAIGIDRWAAVSAARWAAMHVLEWAVGHPERGRAHRGAGRARRRDRRPDRTELRAARGDPHGPAHSTAATTTTRADGDGPHRGLALARRMALLNYRTAAELNDGSSAAGSPDLDPLGGDGRFAVECYLDFHGNKFTRRFDANSYIVLTEAMNSHDVGRGRGGIAAALDGHRARASCSASTATGSSRSRGRSRSPRPSATACTAGIRCSCTRITGTTRS